MIFKFFLISISIFVISCDRGTHMPTETTTDTKREEPSPSQPEQGQAQREVQSGPTYEEDIKPIFDQYCSSCHKAGSGLPNWNNYSEAQAKRDRIFDRVIVQKTMPPQGSPKLQASDIAKLEEWIEHDAPRKSVIAERPSVEVATSKVVSAIDTSPQVLEQKIDTPLLYCEEFKRYKNENIRTSQVLSANLATHIYDVMVSLVHLTFDQYEKISTVENIVLFKSKGTSADICGTYISDVEKCDTTYNISNMYNAHINIECEEDNPIHFELYLVNGYVSAVCKTNHLNLSTQFRTCRVK